MTILKGRRALNLNKQEIDYLYEVLLTDHYYCSDALTRSAMAKHVALIEKMAAYIKENHEDQ